MTDTIKDFRTETIGQWSDWRRRTPKSERLWERAQRVMPGGVNSPPRGSTAFDPYPLYIDRGEGSRVFDVDAHSYVDVMLGLGPVILGHVHPSVTAAMIDQISRGTLFGACGELEVEVAERITKLVPSVEMVRFTNSGTESTMHAIRLARGFTGKAKILKFEGHFHGNHDAVLVSVTPPLGAIGSAHSPIPIPVGSGIPPESYANTLVAVWNDFDGLEKMIKNHKHELAAVIVEPIMANKGFIPPEEGYLQALRKITADNDILLIIDEVITGFRLALGGAQEYFGVRADLVTYAKALGNGATIGAFGGRREIMQLLGTREVRHAGTYNGAPTNLAAASATLDELASDDGKAYRTLDSLGKTLRDGLRATLERLGIDGLVQGTGSMMQLYFTSSPRISSYRDTALVDHAKFSHFAHEMIARGVMVHPDAFEHWFLSTAHSPEDIAVILDVAEDSMKAVAKDRSRA